MGINKDRISDQIEKAILILLTIQICSVSLSIAVSSIAFGIWVGLWLIQILINKKIDYDKTFFSEIKLINIFTLSYFFFEILSRFFALYPEGAFHNLKRLLLFLIFYVSIIKIITFKTLCNILLINICINKIICENTC